MKTKMAKEYKLSAERLEELKQELTYLKTVKEKEVADLIKEARSFGDLSENSEYDEAKNEQGKLYSRIAEVENILANYVVIEENAEDTDVVGMGSKITVKDAATGEEETYQVVGSQEADPMNGRISEDSPFGRALLGKAVGEEVQVEAPAGMLHYKVRWSPSSGDGGPVTIQRREDPCLIRPTASSLSRRSPPCPSCSRSAGTS